MASKNLNVLFLNLSHKNFQMLSEQEPEILYLVLSVDCHEDKSRNLQVILEANENLQAEYMKKDEFIRLLKKIKFKFLVLFGSKSAELASEIESKLHEEKKDRAFVIISLTLNSKHYDLSTFPFVDEEEAVDVAKTAESFTKMEYSQRAMQMTICCIVYLLVKERHAREVTKA